MKEIAQIGTLEEGFSKTVHFSSEGELLAGDWIMPPGARGIVVFAHGSGSSRHSSRNKAVARYLVSRGMGTFLLDLLTPEEEGIDIVTRSLRFDIPLLAHRLGNATKWIQEQPESNLLPIGYFGSSTGSAAALIASAELRGKIVAIVSRGGRPDLAAIALPYVTSPTLLLVGEKDPIVEDLNREAMERMHCTKELSIIAGATHLFEEPGTLDQVAVIAADWFSKYFVPHDTYSEATMRRKDPLLR